VITDQVIAAGGTVADYLQLPFVTVCTAPPWNIDVAQPPPFTGWPYRRGLLARLRNRYGYAGWQWFIAPTLRVINRFRKAWNLPRFASMEASYSPLAQISQLFAEFDFPRSTPPPCFHYVGSLAANRPYGTDGFPWERLDGRPIVYASLGTVADPMNRPVYPKIAAACVGLPAQLILARGNWDNEEGGREASYDLPGNPLVVDYAPQLALLDRSAVLITHAGLNTTLEAISRGVPMVALPRSADQPGNAARIAYSGAGLCAPFHHGTPEHLRGVIQQVLGDDRYRQRAMVLRQAMAAAGGASRAADIIEQALTTGQPVLSASARPVYNGGSCLPNTLSTTIPSSPVMPPSA
jgi:zeaxanthin glucosyltransferase